MFVIAISLLHRKLVDMAERIVGYIAIVLLTVCATLPLFLPMRDNTGAVTVAGWSILGCTVAATVVAVWVKVREDIESQKKRRDDVVRFEEVWLGFCYAFQVDGIGDLPNLASEYLSHEQAQAIWRQVNRRDEKHADHESIQRIIAPLVEILTSPRVDEKAWRHNDNCSHSWREHLINGFSKTHVCAEALITTHRGKIPYELERRMKTVSVCSQGFAEIFESRQEAAGKGKAYLEANLSAFVADGVEAVAQCYELVEGENLAFFAKVKNREPKEGRGRNWLRWVRPLRKLISR